MRKVLATAAALLVVAVLYLALWPVPVNPVAWTAPRDRGLVAPFDPDKRLAAARSIDLGDYHGPEDMTSGRDGRLYVTTESGAIVTIDAYGKAREFARLDGRPLGIELDSDGSFVVANASVGLQRISPGGDVSTILDKVGEDPIVYANDVAIAADGRIFFTESSTKFGARQFHGTYAASLLDLLEHGGHGRVIAYSPGSGRAEVILRDLNYANGIAISKDQSYLLIAETGEYRILRHWLLGPSAGSTEVVIDNLPGFPDNINNGLNGRFWVGLVAPRNRLLDELSDHPLLRKIAQRLPAGLRPAARPSSHVIAISGDGEVLMNLQDPDAGFPALTGVFETRGSLYLTSLFGNRVGVLDKNDL